MPSVSRAQKNYMGMIYGWEKAHGGRTKPGAPSMRVAKEFAQGSSKGLPYHVAKKGKKK